MSRIRSIHPGIASDEAYMSMSMAAKAAWPVLWTECDDHGVFEWKPIVLKARIFPADAVDFTALLAEWEQLGCIQKTEIDGRPVGLIRNFCRYQRPKKPSYRFTLTPDMLNYAGVKADNSPTSTEPVPNQSPTATENPPQMKEEGGSRKEDKKEIRRKAPRRISYPPRFQVFWEAYPTDPLMSKPEALGEWQNLSSEDQEAAINALPAWRAATAKLGPDHRVIHACRYLKKRRFDGFAECAAKTQAFIEANLSAYSVEYGSDEWWAWDADHKAKGKRMPNPVNGHWTFPSRFPEPIVQRETSSDSTFPRQDESEAA